MLAISNYEFLHPIKDCSLIARCESPISERTTCAQQALVNLTMESCSPADRDGLFENPIIVWANRRYKNRKRATTRPGNTGVSSYSNRCLEIRELRNWFPVGTSFQYKNIFTALYVYRLQTFYETIDLLEYIEATIIY